MRTSDFAYDLPAGRIAQTPAEPRDSARLMIVDRAGPAIGHARFRDLPQLLGPGDLLVANDSRVIPARLPGRKAGSGGRVEVLLLRPERAGGRTWRTLVRGRVRAGTRILFSPTDRQALEAEVVELLPSGERRVRFDSPVEPLLADLGQVPLPPYITTPLDDAERYQTVYAKVAGSAAAPTAGLHFTRRLIDELAATGVGFAFVTLHIGLDTFRPVEAELIAEHEIHREWVRVDATAAEAVTATRTAGRRVVAVGTTVVRALEAAALAPTGEKPVSPYTGWTGLFITPGHGFRAVDALITNFHLPRSSLLMLVAAFAGKPLVDRAYDEAIAGDYRFYSFGDAMLIR